MHASSVCSFCARARQSAGKNNPQRLHVKYLSLIIMKMNQINFQSWLAGVVDGDGNFDFRRNTLKAIRIKIHIRDVKILKVIQNQTHMGRIRYVPNTNYVLFIISTKVHMTAFLNLINGYMRVKIPNFQRACKACGLTFTLARQLVPWDAYLAGLIDSDGWVSLNYEQNCIVVGVELNMSPAVEDLNFDYVIPYAKPNMFVRVTASGKKSLRVIYQSVHGMSAVYDYFLKRRLVSDFKFRRVLSIKKFLNLRHYKTCAHGSVEQQIYSRFCVNFLSYQNPTWTKVPMVGKLDKDIVHKLTRS